MVPIATKTHCTTCFNPFARLIALRGRSTRKTRKILITEIVEPALSKALKNQSNQNYTKAQTQTLF